MHSPTAFSNSPYRIGIIGSGALACLFGGRLHLVATVTLVGAWAEQLAALQSGLVIHELDGTETRVPVAATADAKRVGPVDAVLVLVKSTQTAAVIGRISPLLRSDTLIVTLQNGIGNVERLAAAFGADRVSAGVTSVGATLLQPGHVRHAGNGPTVIAHTPDQHNRCTALADRLRAATIPVQQVDDIRGAVWSKLAVNAAINPLTALLGVPNGFLASNPDARVVAGAAAAEVAAVAAANGIALAFPDGHTAADYAIGIAAATATNRSSMLQDIDRRAPTEIDAICGAVVRAGQQSGIPTPVNAQLRDLIDAVEHNRPIQQWNIAIGDRIIQLHVTPR